MYKSFLWSNLDYADTKNYLERWSWFKLRNLGLALRMALTFYTSVARVKPKSQKVLGATTYVCKNHRGKSGRGVFLLPYHPDQG